jgi:signal transduction histidine kinase
VEDREDTAGWNAALAGIRRELRDVRAAFGADWAVVWGPIPFDARAPFVSVLFEDRVADCATAVGLAVPLVGNPWAQALLAEGGAVALDAQGDPRLRLHATVLQRNQITAIASGLYRRGPEVWGVVEVYGRRPLTLPAAPVAALQACARRIAAVVEHLPRRGSAMTAAPANDPMTAAALHDLKNVLAAQSLLVAGFEKELRAAAANPAREWSRLASMLESLAVLRESVIHANELARLMTMGTLGPGARVAIDLPGLVRLALAAIPADLRERFVVDIEPGLLGSGMVPEAPALLRALVNLVQNAALAIQRVAGARATVQVRSEGDDVLIAVEDEGPGVAPEVLERLFEPGVTTRASAEGHGYGLYSARMTVEALGGTLTLYSVPRRLARFTIRLPRERVGVVS